MNTPLTRRRFFAIAAFAAVRMEATATGAW